MTKHHLSSPFESFVVLQASTLAVTLTYSSPSSFCSSPGAQGQGTGCTRPPDRKARKGAPTATRASTTSQPAHPPYHHHKTKYSQT